jgi:hypothetical protein
LVIWASAPIIIPENKLGTLLNRPHPNKIRRTSLELISIGLLSLVVGIIGIALGIYVYSQSPTFPTSRAFLLSMFLFLVGAFLDFALLYAPNYDTALWVARALLFVVVLLFASILYLASFLPYERYSGWFEGKELMLAIIAVFSAVIAVMPVQTVSHTPAGWNADAGSFAFLIWTGIVISYITITIYMIHHACKDVKWEQTRKQSRLLSLSVASPALYAFAMEGAAAVDIEMPSILSPGFLVLATVMAYAILRYRLFLPPVQKEATIKGIKASDRNLDLDQKVLLIEEKRPVRSYRLFLAMLGKGKVGLVITRSYPEIVREQYNLQKTPVLWLAKQPGPNRIEPSNLSILQHVVKEYLRKGESAVIIIDSLEYILENNQEDKVMMMLYNLRDEILLTNSTLILSIDPDTMEESRIALLERDFQTIAA